MLYILVTLAIVSLVASQPIDTLARDSDKPSEEIVFVPYSVKYVPVEVPLHADRVSLNDESNKVEETQVVHEDDDIKILSVSALENKLDRENSDIEKVNTNSKTSTVSQVEDKPRSDPSKYSEDYVLVPISVLKTLELVSSSRTHIVTKRQTPGFQFNGRRIVKRPALVGYLNNYDFFPTVA